MKLDFSRKLSFLISVCVLSFVWSACDSSNECDQTTDISTTVSLYKVETINNETSITSFAPESFTFFPLERVYDSIIKFQNNIEEFNIDLNPTTDFTEFVFLADGIQDTIIINHTSEIHLISVSCGFTYFFDINEITYTSNGIHSIEITDGITDTYERENIKIYYK